MTVVSDLSNECASGLKKITGRSEYFRDQRDRSLSLVELHERRIQEQCETQERIEFDEGLPAIPENDDILNELLLSCPVSPCHDDDDDLSDAVIDQEHEPVVDGVTVEVGGGDVKQDSTLKPTRKASSAVARVRRLGKASHRVSLAILVHRHLQRSIVCNDDLLRALMLSIYDPDRDLQLPSMLSWFSDRFRTDLNIADLRSSCGSPLSCLKQQLSSLISCSGSDVSPSTSAILFTLLCRTLHLPARLIAVLDPLPVAPTKLLQRFSVAASADTARGRPCPCKSLNRSPYFSMNDDDAPLRKRRVGGRSSSSRASAMHSWVEVLLKGSWVPVNLLKGQIGDRKSFESLCSVPLTYVVGINDDKSIMDVVKRYASSWAAVIRRTPSRSWWEMGLKAYGRRYPAPDSAEERAELNAFADEDKIPDKLDDFRNHPKYAIKKFLKKYEVIYPDNEIIGEVKGHQVYSRSYVHTLHSKENWLREPMRTVRHGEVPFKKVKSRSRKVDADEMQGLYGLWQTDPWSPEPILNGIVPTSVYGHCELWTDRHLPDGAVHIDLPRIQLAARKCRVHFAPAMMGFQSGCMGSVPIIQGIVTAAVNKEAIVTIWQEMEQRRAENAERRRVDNVVRLWRAVVKGTVVRHQIMMEKHGDDAEVKSSKRRRVDVKLTEDAHVHEMREEWDPNRNIWRSGCECGLILEEEDL